MGLKSLNTVICCSMEQSEEGLVAGLLDAQSKAKKLFTAVQTQNLIRPGAKESEVNEGIYAPCREHVRHPPHWHKRIVRAGPNTLAPYDENPPVLTVGRMTLSFSTSALCSRNGRQISGGPNVLGDDPLKRKLCHDIEEAFASGKQHFHEHPEITAAQLYAHAQQLAERASWEYGGPIAGHLTYDTISIDPMIDRVQKSASSGTLKNGMRVGAASPRPCRPPR